MNIHLQQKVTMPSQKLLILLTDHARLSRFFNATFNVLNVSTNSLLAGGEGCLREVTTRGSTFIEEIVKADHQGIEYRIVGDKPLKNHQGIIRFIADESYMTIDYRISGQVVGWLPSFIVKYVIEKDIQKALSRIAKYAALMAKEHCDDC